jgi:hypothetical protein
VNASLQHTGSEIAAQQLFLPDVMSRNTPAVFCKLYSAGVTKPTFGFPAACLAELMSVSMAANNGVEADVPLT